MGFFSSIGEALFGTETKKQGKELAAAGGKSAAAVGTEAAKQGKAAGKEAQFYDAAAKRSMGGSAQEYMNKANVAAQGQAEQAGTAAATAGTQAALRAARSSGLSKGQAALTSGQQAGDIYSGTYQRGLETGRDQYQQATGQLAGQGAQMAGRQQGALNTQLGAATGQAGIGAGQQQAAAQTAQNTWGTIGTIAGAALMSDEGAKTDVEEIKPKKDWGAEAKKIGEAMLARSSGSEGSKTGLAGGLETGMKLGNAMFGKDIAKEATGAVASAAPAIAAAVSDEDAKQNIDISRLDVGEIAKKIRPVRFKYKQEIIDSGKGTDGEHVGVIAQDLENTPLAKAVIEGDDGFKRIDTTELSPAILNLVIQLARKVEKLEGDK